MRADRDALNAFVDKAEQYATQGIAHFNRKEPTDIPKLQELDAALDVFEKLVRRYRLLLKGEGGPAEPANMHPWETVLTVP